MGVRQPFAVANRTVNHMGMAASIALEGRSVQARMGSPSRFGDKAFEWLTLAMALAVVVLIILIGWQLWIGSSVAIKKFGFHFLVTSTWDPVAEQFGALPFIYGTLVSSLIALLIAFPLGIATAAYLTELAPLWIRRDPLGGNPNRGTKLCQERVVRRSNSWLRTRPWRNDGRNDGDR